MAAIGVVELKLKLPYILVGATFRSLDKALIYFNGGKLY